MVAYGCYNAFSTYIFWNLDGGGSHVARLVGIFDQLSTNMERLTDLQAGGIHPITIYLQISVIVDSCHNIEQDSTKVKSCISS